MSKHTILFLAANPSGSTPLKLAAEARAIQHELERGGMRHRFEFETRWAVTPLDLLREVRKLKPSIVHFSGHGEGGTLHFESEAGRARAVTTEAIADTFAAAGSSVKVVVLNACYSESHAAALKLHVDCVIGMTSTVDDAAARTFALGFYGGLAEGESVHAAFRQGCAAIRLENLPDGDVPHLDTRAGVDAAGIVLAADPR